MCRSEVVGGSEDHLCGLFLGGKLSFFGGAARLVLCGDEPGPDPPSRCCSNSGDDHVLEGAYPLAHLLPVVAEGVARTDQRYVLHCAAKRRVEGESDWLHAAESCRDGHERTDERDASADKHGGFRVAIEP